MSQLLSPSAARIPGEPRPGELLLELLSEEIPARMQRRAIEDLTRLLRDKLAAAELAAADIRGYVTPRRLVVIADGIPPTQPDRTEERRGPRVGAPQAAIDGFLRSAGLASIDKCEIRDSGRGEFYFAIIRRPGRPSAEVLPELVKAAIAELPWSKSMRWPGASLRWVRPLTSIICLYDGAVVPLAIDGVPVGRTTRGHRFLSPAEFCADNAAEYRRQAAACLRRRRPRPAPRTDPHRPRDAGRGVGAKGQTRSGATRRGDRPRRIPGCVGRRDRCRFHDLAARSAADRDAHASKVFFVRSIPRARRRRISCSSPTTSPRTAARRSSPATSACCAPASPTPAFSGTRTARSALKTASRRSKTASTTPSSAPCETRPIVWSSFRFSSNPMSPALARCACDNERAHARESRPLDRDGRRVPRTARSHGSILRDP